MYTIEIEDYYGNTIGILKISKNNYDIKGDISIADIEDNNHIRIQIEDENFKY
jgi:hypothetical protein